MTVWCGQVSADSHWAANEPEVTSLVQTWPWGQRTWRYSAVATLRSVLCWDWRTPSWQHRDWQVLQPGRTPGQPADVSLGLEILKSSRLGMTPFTPLRLQAHPSFAVRMLPHQLLQESRHITPSPACRRGYSVSPSSSLTAPSLGTVSKGNWIVHSLLHRGIWARPAAVSFLLDVVMNEEHYSCWLQAAPALAASSPCRFLS